VADETLLEPGGDRLVRLAFPSEPARLRQVRDAVRRTAERSGCSADGVEDTVIAVDEACQNVIRHAYHGAADGEIVLEIYRKGDTLVIYLRDFAEAVDKDKISPRDLDDLRPGGLGTHFMREVMDEVKFMPPPADGGNLLRMVKRIAKDAENAT